MIQRYRSALVAIAMAAVVAVPAVGRAKGDRCGSVNGGGLHCSGCPESYIAALPHVCAADETQVIYDLDKPFPLDSSKKSNVIIRARPGSPCAGMTDTVPPLSNEPGAIEVPISGFAVGCWGRPDKDGCRVVKFLNGGTMCLHIADEKLGSGCTGSCANLSTEQVAISTAGAAEHFVCPPANPSTSCRAMRSPNPTARAGEGFRLWVGGFCATNGCDNPGTPQSTVGPNTCVAGWGATFLGYAIGKSKPLGPGWYDWQSGAFKIDYRNGKATCGTLGACLGSGNSNPWDLSLVGVPRASTPPPCLTTPSGPCDAPGCSP
jgi:hypothetical protein